MNVLFFGSEELKASLTANKFGQEWEVTCATDSQEVADFAGTHLFQGAIAELGRLASHADDFAKQAKHFLQVPIVIGFVDPETSNRSIERYTTGIDILIEKNRRHRFTKLQCDAALRLANGAVSEDIVCGQVTYHTSRNVFSVSGRDIHLPYKKHRLLQLLFLKQGRTVTKDMVFNYLYGWEEPPAEKVVDVFVCQIRKQLRDLGAVDEVICTVWGQGYTVPKVQSGGVLRAA